MSLTGIDIPISLIRDNLVQNLWNDVSSQIYYALAYRNLIDIDGTLQLIPEVFTTVKDYREVLFDNKWNVLVFFDVDPVRNNVIDQAETELRVIFAVNLDNIYPGSTYRQVENVHADVLQVIRDTSNVSIDKPSVNIVSGLDAYGDFYTGNITAYNMQPFHTFSVNMTLKYVYDCNDSQNDPVTPGVYPDPILK
jgi:hypothetical protein